VTRHAESLARSIGHLDWFKIPHTLDQVVGIYAEATAELAGTTSRSRSNSEMVEAIRAQSLAGGHGKGGHSDPTPAAALRGQPDAVDDDETMGMIDASLADLTEASDALDHLVSDVLGRPRWNPPATARNRQGMVADAASRLHHLSAGLPVALDRMDRDQMRDADSYLLVSVAESAEWLHVKAETIWLSSRGESRPSASQQPGERPRECACCSPWRKGTIANRGDYCDQCANFRSNHDGALPIEGIVRRWEYGKGATPALIVEAQAASKRKARAS